MRKSWAKSRFAVAKIDIKPALELLATKNFVTERDVMCAYKIKNTDVSAFTRPPLIMQITRERLGKVGINLPRAVSKIGWSLGEDKIKLKQVMNQLG